MKPFEEVLARQKYLSECRERATLKRKTDRHLTREEANNRRKARYSAAAGGICFFLLAVVLLVLALFPRAEAREQEKAAPARVLRAEPEAAENERIEAALLARAARIENVKVTHYCVCETCCGKTPEDPAYGITASGLRATPGVSVGVDPDVIPLGADVLVDYGDGELHYYRADDTGSGVTGAHIDLCVGSHEEALQAGVRTATVWWVMP